MTVIHAATTDDLTEITRLWGDYQRESHARGDFECPTVRTLAWYLGRFLSILYGLERGLILLAESPDGPVGVLVAIEMQMRVDHRLGQLVEGLGTYVDPDWRGQGISRRLHREAIQRLGEMGFETYLASHQPSSPGGLAMLESAGARTLQTLTVLSLKGATAAN